MSSQMQSLVSEEQEDLLEDDLLEEVSAEEQEARRLEILEALGQRLHRLADTQVQDRVLIEERWVEDLRQWHGRYDPATERKLAEDPNRSKVFTNLTRTKANSAESRLIETILPIDDRNWELKTTPVPDYDESRMLQSDEFVLEYGEPEEPMGDPAMDPAMGMPPEQMDPMGMPPEQTDPMGMPPEQMDPSMGMPPGQMDPSMGMPPEQMDPSAEAPPEPPELTAEEILLEKRVDADARCRAMQDEIDDQLTECRYNNIQRQVIHSAVVLGTGVLKGPIVVGKTRKRWQKITDEMTGETVHVVTETPVKRPIVEFVDLWNFFPDMSATCLDEAEFVFERGFYTKSRMRSLLKRPGFSRDQIKRVLEQGPHATRIDRSHMDRIREISGLSAAETSNLFEVWIYSGPVEKDDLVACGCEDAEDLDGTDEIWADVWLVGTTVIKADISLVDTLEHQYSVFCWEEDESSIFGYGVPWRSRNPQRMANAALRMIMENGALAARPQLVYNQDVCEPADGDPRMGSGKGWRVTDRNVSVNSAFGLFEIPSHLAELSNIFMLSKQLMDEETAIPALPAAQDVGQMSATLGGMSILMNQANIVLRRVVKAYDDNVTVPTIRRFYDYNMQYSPREDIKGDYEIDARGTSALLAREAQSAALIQIMQYAGSPMFQNVFKPEILARQIAKALQLPVDQLVNTPSDIRRLNEEQAQNQPQDPALEKAKLMADAMANKMQITYQMHTERMAQQVDEFRLRAIEAQKNWETQVMKLLGEQELGADKIKSELAKVSMKLSSENDRFLKEMSLKSLHGPTGNYGLE